MKKRILLLALALLTVAACFVPALSARAATTMVSSDALISKMKAREGFSATPYWDHSHYSIGYGTTCPEDQVEYYKKNPMTEAQAEAEFRKFLTEFEADVNAFAAKHKLTLQQHQFDALVSFTYNCGAGWMSSLSGYFNTAVRAGSIGEDLLYGMALYSTASGEYILIGRRLWEANMYINGDYGEGEKGSYPDNYRWVFLDAGPGQVRYKICAFDTNHKASLPEAFSHIPTGKDEKGNTFIYDFGGWYTASGKRVAALDSTLTRGQTLYARWLDPQGNALSATTQTFPKKATVVNVDTTVNVRKGPGTSYSKNGTLAKGAQVTVLEEVQGEYVSYCGTATWCKIANDKYVNKYYLQYPEAESNTQTETTAKLTKLEVVKAPTQTVFTEHNISPDWEGGVLKATYADGFVKALTITRSMTSGFNPGTNGKQTVTVSYGGKTATFPVSVQLASGWKQDAVGICYLENGVKVQSVWKKDSKGWRHLGPDGYVISNTWIKDSKGWSYAGAGGYLTVNKWVKDSKGYRYCGPTGYVVENTWISDPKGWSYAGSGGYLALNTWVKDGEGYRYCGPTGFVLTSQWLPYGDCKCYVDADGFVSGSQLQHRFVGYRVTAAATCTTNAVETGTCEKCGKTDVRTVAGSALGHSFTQYISDGNATATEDGTKTAKCDRCSVTHTVVDAGSKLTADGWGQDSTGWYYLEKGKKVTSVWKKSRNGYRYVGSAGYVVENTWISDPKGWSYAGKDGYLTVNQWVKHTKGYRYCGPTGFVVENTWISDPKGWSYAGKDGYLTVNQWVKHTKGYRYCGPTGFVVENTWVSDSKGWSYAGAGGYLTVNQWVKDSKGYRYCGPTGYVLTNQYISSSKGLQYVDKNGYWDGKYR